MKIGPRKLKLLHQIKDVDNKMLAFCNNKPIIHLENLTMKDLRKLLEAFNTVYELFIKCSNKENKDGRIQNEE